MNEMEYKIEATSWFTPYFRLRPKSGIKGIIQAIFCIKYHWTPYILYTEYNNMTGYDQWGCEYVLVKTPKEARDYFIANPNGFEHNEKVEQMLQSKKEGYV